MALSAELLRLIERKTGQPINKLQEETIWDRRCAAEADHGEPMKLLRLFPFIGRGSVMGDYILSHSEVDRQLNKALR